MLSCCHFLLPERWRAHPLVSLISTRLVPMAGDLLAASDSVHGVIYLRKDATEQLLHVAFLRELDKVMYGWTGGEDTGQDATVVPLRQGPLEERHGVG